MKKLVSGIKSGEIAEKPAIPNPTVKRILLGLQSKGMIEKQVAGGRNSGGNWRNRHAV